MASNFKIISYQRCDSLYLKLVGDFDGSSAWELINLIKKTPKSYRKIFVNTSGLNNIYPFGVGTFQKNLTELKKDQICLLFKGNKSNRISAAFLE
ncbi:MAG TPA: hypothetical protein PLQ82_07445 [Desulfobacteraceae bacterium]|nr:hypothetical protein [Desulfobacteraceae bacterium]HPQ28300.1 hypothetical protein [Desulfobacteraceae bacterium]